MPAPSPGHENQPWYPKITFPSTVLASTSGAILVGDGVAVEARAVGICSVLVEGDRRGETVETSGRTVVDCPSAHEERSKTKHTSDGNSRCGRFFMAGLVSAERIW